MYDKYTVVIVLASYKWCFYEKFQFLIMVSYTRPFLRQIGMRFRSVRQPDVDAQGARSATLPRDPSLSSMTLRPLQDRVLIRPVEQEAKSPGGIIIPDSAKEKPVEGEVLAVGPGIRGDDGALHRPELTAGDRVLYGKWSGNEIKLDGEDLVIMRETDILGIVD